MVSLKDIHCIAQNYVVFGNLLQNSCHCNINCTDLTVFVPVAFVCKGCTTSVTCLNGK